MRPCETCEQAPGEDGKNLGERETGKVGEQSNTEMILKKLYL